MAKDPAVLFYTSDFLSETVLMNNEEIGQYIKLLCIQHQKGTLTENDIKKVCPEMSEDVLKLFVRKPDGTYANARLDEEISRRKAYTESRRNNRKKKEEKNSNVTEKNICSSYDEHMEAGTETGTETGTEAEAKTEARAENDVLADAENDSKTANKAVNQSVSIAANTAKGSKRASSKLTYAEFVTMTNDEHSSLVEKFGMPAVDRMIEILNNYKGANGKQYKSDYLAILSWVAAKVLDERVENPNDPRFMGTLKSNLAKW